MAVIYDRFRVRRGTATAIAAANQIPLEGEIVLELDTGLYKIGDGVTAYNSLLYSGLGLIDLTGIGDGDTIQWDAVNGRWEVGAAAGGGHTIQEAGVNQTARTNLNFVGFDVSDDAGGDATVVTLPTSVSTTLQAKQLISTVTNPSGGTFTFTIPTGYDRITMEGEIRAASTAFVSYASLFFNGDTSQANYHSQRLEGINGNFFGNEDAGVSIIAFVPDASADANRYATVTIIIDRPDDSRLKSAAGFFEAYYALNSACVVGQTSVGHDTMTAAITSLTVQLNGGGTGTLRCYGEKQVAVGGTNTTDIGLVSQIPGLPLLH